MKAEKSKDRRVLRTRDTLGDALMNLMLEKDFDEISVQEVLDRACVGRSTFYVHYRDKQDLFLSDVEDFFEMFATLLERRGADAKRLAPVEEFCAHVREAEEFYKALVRSEKLNDVLALGRGYFARSIEERLRVAGVEMDAARRTARAHALAGSMFALIEWWMDKGMKADAKELDDVFHQMAWSGLGLGHTG